MIFYSLILKLQSRISYIKRKLLIALYKYKYRRMLVKILFRFDYNLYFSRKIINLFRELQEQNTLGINKKYSEHFVFDHKTIWSSQRSGNHWVRFIAEYLTGYPTSGCIENSWDFPVCLNTFPSGKHPLTHVNLGKPFVLYKSHCAYTVTPGSVILLLIRDPHEHLAHSHNARFNIPTFVFYYLDLIVAYNRFCGAKILIYYEDLLKYPEKEICRIKDFLGAPDERYKAFMARYDYYAQLSKQARGRNWGGNNSAGDTKFHQKKLSKQEMLIRKNFFHAISEIKCYQCVKPYLARYE